MGLLGAVAACLLLSAETRAADASAADTTAGLEARVAQLEARLSIAEHAAEIAADRGSIENVFSNYMYLHNAFHDEQIKALWVKRGTPGASAQYTNAGVYTNYDSIMAYHTGRPSPTGKLILHYATTPSIVVAGDGKTAKGIWIVAGVESGLSAPAQAAAMPPYMIDKLGGQDELVHGKKVWAHWVQMKYGVDFLKQDGEWKIWHFRCYEVSRARFDKDWISLAAEVQDDAKNNQFNADLMYLGEDGKPVFMPKVDAPPKTLAYPYRPDHSMELQPKLPVPYGTFSETFEY